MSKDAPYTLTVYVAAPGTPLVPGGTSAAGHMYLAVKHDGLTQSFGFAPAKHGASSGPGAVTNDDVSDYVKPYYARTMEITKDQYEKILAYGGDAAKHGFDMEYNGLSNSCIDFTWSALNYAGLHRQSKSGQDKDYEGAVRPLENKQEIKKIPAPVPGSKLNTEHENPMPKQTNFQKWISENGPYEGVEGDPMMAQIRGKVAELDAANGRTFDPTSERVSASLFVLAKENGLSRVDHVMLSERTAQSPAAENIFVVQGERGDPGHLRAAMATAQAAQTPVEVSMERGEQLTNNSQLAQQQNDQVQSQERDATARRMG
ncbi:XVIPCD domain-containing protein [Stenotrophomonas sp.]|uniref:XVIPCD domain-containing protein n=1 Tax=Stenotrophomonas sp. TaxID=69392 RepID=UPI0028AE7D88|nr:XVIPCD domain-containing protein [Stenotrophomonas sp.]